jgi:hypothetical protein
MDKVFMTVESKDGFKVLIRKAEVAFIEETREHTVKIHHSQHSTTETRQSFAAISAQLTDVE